MIHYEIETLPDYIFPGDEWRFVEKDFHPDYVANGFFYVNYTDSGGTTRIVRYQVSADPDLADVGSAAPVLSIGQPQANHNGGWIGFGPDGYLYVATGDGGGARHHPDLRAEVPQRQPTREDRGHASLRRRTPGRQFRHE